MKAKERKVLADRNPKVDLREVGEGLKMVQKLREMGVTPRGYNLARPYSPSTSHSTNEGRWNS